MKPTLEEVKAYFKNAKEARSTATHKIFEICHEGINECLGSFFDGNDKALYSSAENRYAEIISYKQTFEYLEEVEVSDDNSPWFIRQFISNLPDGTFATWTKEVGQLSYYKHIRKLNTERTQAIETIKELMLNHKIEPNEIK